MKTLLIYRLGSLGDTIVALPCLHKIAEKFPDTQRVVLTNKPISPVAPSVWDVLEGSGLIHGAVEYPLGTRSPAQFAYLWLRLRRLKPDALVYLVAPRGGQRTLSRDLAFFRACGIRKIVGAPMTPDLLINRLDSGGEEEYECERLARCLAGLGEIDLSNQASWDLRLSLQERERAEQRVAAFRGVPFVALNMGGKAIVNDWGHQNWVSLVGLLRDRINPLKIVFVGAARDWQRADDLSHELPALSLNFCGELSVRETAGVLSRASLFVGHDSGPMHLAAACGVRCVGIFSSLNRPHKWYPYGAAHRILHSAGPISTIQVDDVCEAVLETLSSIGQTSQQAVPRFKEQWQ
jgi:heptosyltransferase-3